MCYQKGLATCYACAVQDGETFPSPNYCVVLILASSLATHRSGHSGSILNVRLRVLQTDISSP